jgi:hypothetical protein
MPSTDKPHHIAVLAHGPSLHQYVALAKAIGGREAFCDEVWAVNSVGSVLACDLVFHMDDVRIQQIRADAAPDSNIAHMLNWLKITRTTVMTSRGHTDYPSLVEYPLEHVLNSTGGMPYFNSTPAYALALALACFADGAYPGGLILSLFGLDYTYANAHDAEKGRACIEFWCGRAHALGVDVRVSDKSSLLDSCEAQSLYGYGAFGSRDVALTRDEDGRLSVKFAERAALPTAQEIEAAYDHSRHPSPLVSGVTQPED